MNPRKKQSTKWTSLPKELCQQINTVFTDNFAQLAKTGQFIVEGRIYPDELLLRVGYTQKNQLVQANFEVSMDIDAIKENALKMIHVAVDCAASMTQQYVAAGGDLEEFPRIWQPFDIDGKKVFLQLTTVNTDLESAANKLLGVADDSLVQGDDDDD